MTPPERSALKRGYHECKIAKLQKAFARLQRKAQARLTHEPTAAAAGAAARLLRQPAPLVVPAGLPPAAGGQNQIEVMMRQLSEKDWRCRRSE